MIRQATWESRTSAARGVGRGGAAILARIVALDADRAAPRRVDALQPDDTVTQPQRRSVNHRNLCWLSVQLLRERDWCGFAVGQHGERHACRGDQAGAEQDHQPLRIEMGQSGTKNPSRAVDRQGGTSIVARCGWSQEPSGQVGG